MMCLFCKLTAKKVKIKAFLCVTFAKTVNIDIFL